MKKTNWKGRGKKVLQFLCNPRFLLCFGIAWLLTNGWSYIMMAVGTWLNNAWMITVAGAYLTFLWLPISPEKLVTFAIAIWLLRWLFPEDTKTLAVMRRLHRNAKAHWNAFREKHRRNREKKTEQDGS